MSGEIWRVVPSVPQYMASSEGRIMVVPYIGFMPNGSLRHYGGQPHFGVWSKQDERFICVLKGKTYKVHRLVCEAFNGQPPFEKPVCMHVDENSANNRPSNLQWGTQKENLNSEGFKVYQSQPVEMRKVSSKPQEFKASKISEAEASEWR